MLPAVPIWFEREGREGLEERRQGSFNAEDAEFRRGKAEKMVWQGRGVGVDRVAWTSRLGGLPVRGCAGGFARARLRAALPTPPSAG